MKALWLGFVLLLTAIGASAQTANVSASVVALTSDDSLRVQQAHDSLLKAQKDWDAVQQYIKQTYLGVKKNDPDASESSFYIGSEDQNGLLFSGSSEYVTCAVSFGSCDEPKESPQEVAKEKAYEDANIRYYRKSLYPFAQNGFDFSTDFKFIVPKPLVPTNNSVLFTCAESSFAYTCKPIPTIN